MRRYAPLFVFLGLCFILIGTSGYIRHRYRTYIPPARGMVLGLYAGQSDFDYGPDLKRIAALGARAVTLQPIYLMKDRRALDVTTFPDKSPTEIVLRRSCRQAKALGMKVLLFPTINLSAEASDPSGWRGNIEPSDWDTWWKNYTVFNVGLAKIAEEEGVVWYSVGTEMESTHRFTEEWKRLIAEVRKVYQGRLTYSVNFDAHDNFEFGDALDVIGMNAYDPIHNYETFPSDSAITEKWWWIIFKARTLQQRFNKPVMITELGYSSSELAHRYPWDFRSSTLPYPDRQARLIDGALDVVQHWTEGEAVFYYLYGENLRANIRPGGSEDVSYSPLGKPAESMLRRYFAVPKWAYEFWWGPYPQSKTQGIQAQEQIILGHLRRQQQKEIKVLPAWVLRWGLNNPERFKILQSQVQQEQVRLK